MKRNNGWLFVILGLITIIYFTWISPGFGQGFLFSERNTGTHEVEDSLVGIKEIHITGSSANIQVVPEESNEFSASLNERGTKKFELFASKHGDVLKLELKRKKRKFLPQFINFNFFRSEARLTVKVPQQYDNELSLNVVSGNIAVKGSPEQPLQLATLDVSATSGNITMIHLDLTKLVYTGTSGNIKADNIRAEQTEWTAKSGNAKLSQVQGNIKVRLTSGNLNIDLEELSGTIDANITSGRTVLDLPDDANFTLNAQVKSGMINCDFPLADATIESHRKWKGTYGSGEHAIDLKATSGMITIR